jgi:hypothetical protein
MLVCGSAHLTTGMELDADGHHVRRGLFIGAVGVRPRQGTSGGRPSAYRCRRRRGGYAEGCPRRLPGPRRRVSITSPRTRTVTARSRRQPDAEGYPRHRAWPPYADGHPRHIGFFYFIFIFSLSYYFILCFYYLFTSMNYVKNGSIF